MFDNIGGKIMTLALVICLLGMVASVISGVVLIFSDMTVVGLVTIVAGCLGSWLGSFCLYGFGHLIECMDDVRDSLKVIERNTKDATAAAPVRKPLPVVQKPAAVTPVSVNAVKPANDWLCRCGMKNSTNAFFCSGCGNKR